jgi:signal peptidase I
VDAVVGTAVVRYWPLSRGLIFTKPESFAKVE